MATGLLLRLSCSCVLAGAGQVSVACCAPIEWAADVSASSELSENGIRLPFAGFVTQGQLTAWAANGWSASASLARDSHATGRGVLHAGYSRAASDDVELGVGLTRYEYSGANVAAWRRFEASATLSWRDIASASVAAVRFDAKGIPLQWSANAAVHWPVAPATGLVASVGTAAVPSGWAPRYAYGSVGVEWRAGNFHASASRVASHAFASSRYVTEHEQRPRWVAVIGWTFE